MPKHTRPPRRQTAHSNTYRFFVPAAALNGEHFALADSEFVHQINNVLRLRPGEQILVLDGSGAQFVVELEAVERRQVTGRVLHQEPATNEPRTLLTLYAALIKPERFEWLLQKGTELGTSAFVPLLCERSARADADTGERKHERWSRIVREAAEQSRRGVLPTLAPVQEFAAACDAAARADLALLLWEAENAAPLRDVLRARAEPPQSVAVLSGPEGGLSEAGRERAAACGIIPVTLGPRTLRAETAPLAAATAILYELGDMNNVPQT